MTTWDLLHPTTRRSLRNTKNAAVDVLHVYPCGCRWGDENRISLCQYHTGMEVGLALAENPYYPETQAKEDAAR